MVDIKLLRTDDVNKTLCSLIDEHDEFHWAVAWGSMMNATKALLKNTEKFRDVTFGVAFSQTHPDLVDALQGIERARVATKFVGGTYHPKVYGFRSGDRAEAIVGSANFTFGGLDKNWEASIQVIGDIADPFFVDIFKFTKESAKYGQAVTPDFAAAYRASFGRASRMAKPPRDPMDGIKLINPTVFTSPLVSMDWSEYVAEIKASEHHDVAESLTLLRIAQKWLASVRSFSDLSPEKRKAIAGLLGERQKISPDLDHDWGWFGSMKGMGDFFNRINANDRHLARALDSIPQKGEVTSDHFRNFVKHFRKAFKNSTRMGGVPTASRLLVMKRPDTFVCICKPNIVEAASRMGFSRTTLELDDYWDKVVEVLRLAKWYNTDKPDNAEGELWENRAAMLDAIFYRPIV
ncbi:phospholipase D family protein [Mesorhizobium sp. SP-1A]|uniref:phospholipase D family protein n=1 Tax=Mesorhizobium sp. SP-1A TaxID=3077840 RepID=UPI0028F74C6D|nr:phospholipase D family protein [Mesorhizobium sp. SP-1A]